MNPVHVPKPMRPGCEFQVDEAGVVLHGVPGSPLREEMASELQMCSMDSGLGASPSSGTHGRVTSDKSRSTFP